MLIVLYFALSHLIHSFRPHQPHTEFEAPQIIGSAIKLYFTIGKAAVGTVLAAFASHSLPPHRPLCPTPPALRLQHALHHCLSSPREDLDAVLARNADCNAHRVLHSELSPVWHCYRKWVRYVKLVAQPLRRHPHPPHKAWPAVKGQSSATWWP